MSPITDDPERIKLDNKITFCLGFGVGSTKVGFVFSVVVVVLFDVLAPTLWSSGIWTKSQKPLNNAFPLNATENINRTRMYFRQAPISLYLISKWIFNPVAAERKNVSKVGLKKGQDNDIYYNSKSFIGHISWHLFMQLARAAKDLLIIDC